MSLKVGITGGIGAGKTTVISFFKLLNVPVYLADDRAKWLMSNSIKVKQKIISLLGEKAYEDTSLNRRFVAEKVFPNPALLDALNAIVHPAVNTDFEKWLTEQNSPYVVKEAALLFETDSYKLLDQTILVTASEKTRIDRIKKRDPERTTKEISAIIAKQWSEEDKVALADYIINNDNTLIIPQLLSLDKKFRSNL